jgi:acylphosphatase
MSAEAEGGVVRMRVIFSGTVQGVSFRATARHLAGRRPVVGFVRNLADGRVELEAEGTCLEVDALLADIERDFAGYIEDRERQSLPVRGGESRFEIRY